jgi:hypothetical protein
LTGGGLWQPVRGAVEGVHGGDVAGAVAGHNRRGKWCLVTVRVWRSFEHGLIGQRITRKGKGPHRSDEGSTAALARLARGKAEEMAGAGVVKAGLGRVLL